MAVTTPENARSEGNGSPVAPPAPAFVDFDVYLVLIVAALLAIGLLMVYSTTFDWSFLEYGTPVRIFLNQVRSLAVGLVALVVAWRIDYRILRDRRVALAIMVVTILALGGLLVINNNRVLGAERSFFQGSIQPGEAAKLAVIIYFAAWLASRQGQLQRVGYGLIPFSILVGLVGGLIVLQPDLSTAFIIVLTAWTMFFVAGANIVQILLAGTGAGFVAWILSTQFDYARQRLIQHVAAMQDLTQASWHVQQAIIAFTAPGSRGSGTFSPNWFGVGLGQSRQKFGFLPAAHTDSIFAIIGEELGLFGCLVVITLFVLFVWRTFKIAGNAQDTFGSLLAVGIGSWIAYEALLNVSVMTAVIPFTGVPLPFISYGGSSLVTVRTSVGLLMSISRRRPLKQPGTRLINYDMVTGPVSRRFARIGRRSGTDY
ncbi:MAG: cell division protein FtsW [Chloroflexi bacterium]|nr:cell division protein FtsW [Chloroflexota bacterium]